MADCKKEHFNKITKYLKPILPSGKYSAVLFKYFVIYLLTFMFFHFADIPALSQTPNSVGIGTLNPPYPDASAVLEIYSTDKGFMVPRMTKAEKLAIAPPAAGATGLFVYQTDPIEGFYYWDNTQWLWIGTSLVGNYVYGTGAPGQVGYWTASSTITGDNGLFWVDGTSSLGIGTTTPQENLEIVGGLRISNTTNTNAGAIRWNPVTNDYEGYTGVEWKSFTKNDLAGEGSAGQVAYWESSTFIAGDDQLFWDMTDTWLGIGTNTPQEMLEVVGGIHIGNTASNNTGAMKWDGSDFFGYMGPVKGWLSFTTSTLTGSGSATQVTYWNSPSNLTGDNNLYWDESSTFLGIGTTTPREALDINGALILGNTTPSSATVTGTMRWTGTDFEGYDGSSWLSFTQVSGITGLGYYGQVTFWDSPTSLSGDYAHFFDIPNKRLGIKTNVPTHDLTVNGVMRAGMDGISGQFILYSEQGVADKEVYIIPSSTMSQNTIYTFPGNHGVVNDVLTTYGDGNLYWAKATVALGDFWQLVNPAGPTGQSLVTFQDYGLARYTAVVNGGSAAIRKSQINFGVSSTSNGSSAAILGGLSNQATADYAFVAGGESNIANAANTTILGGSSNNLTGIYSLAGGSGNTISGQYSIIPNGQNLTVSGDRTFAFRGGLTTTPYTLATSGYFYILDANFHFNANNQDVDFEVDASGASNLMYMDASTNRIGIGSNAPLDQFDVRGDVALTNSSSTASSVQFMEPVGSGSNYSQFTARAQNDSNLVYKLPPWHNVAHSAMFNNLYASGDGILEWASPEQVNGYLRSVVYTTTTNYTPTISNVYIIVRNSSNVTITLPLASTVPGKRYYIKRMSTSSSDKVTINPSGTNKIDGANSYVSSKMKETIMLVSDGSNWYIFTKYFGVL